MKKEIFVLLLAAVILTLSGCKRDDYDAACALQDAQNYAEAAAAFESLGNYEDAAQRAETCREWADSIAAFDAASTSLTEENAKLDAAIQRAEAAIDANKPAMDSNLYQPVKDTVAKAKDARVTVPDRPDELDDMQNLTAQMETADYTGLVEAITDACNDLDESIQQYAFVDAPDNARVLACLAKVPEILLTVEVTEETDGNNMLGKDGSYIGRIIFAASSVSEKVPTEKQLLSDGVDAGGTIEIFATRDDAEKRDMYLGLFDGSLLASGSHTVVGTVLVRTSNDLSASKQAALESAIIEALLSP